MSSGNKKILFGSSKCEYRFIVFERYFLFDETLQVLVGHVKEAFRLLSKSIIRVETPDINLEEEPEAPETTGQ